MKKRLKSKTLADARREIYATETKMPYKIVMGRCFTDENETQMELCYYAFDTEEDYREWNDSKNRKDKYYFEHQLTGPQVLRDINRHPDVKRWFASETKEEIMNRIKLMHGCSAETARWVYKNLQSKYGNSVIKINE